MSEAPRERQQRIAFDQGFILAVAEIMRQHGEDVIARDVMRANPIKDWSVIDEHDRDALAPIFEHEKMQAAFEGVNSNAQ